MTTIDAFQRLSLALAIGLLVGVERGWQEREVRTGGRTAGIRTFGLVGFLGGLAGLLYDETGPELPAVLVAALSASFIVFKARELREDEDYSITGIVAALVVFGLGVVAVLGDEVIAAASGVAVTGLLAARNSLHGFLRRLTWPELRAALVLLTMTVVALPLLPNRTVDPWNALNPFDLWLLTIIIATISFAGYIAIKVAGPEKGVLFAGAAGGLASSTALTLSFGHLAVQNPKNSRELAAGACIAGGLSLIRALAIGSATAPRLFMPLAAALISSIVVLFASGALLARFRTESTAPAELHIDNPFDLSSVLRFGLLLAVITVLSKFLLQQAGTSSIFAVAAASGLVDIDAITLSTAQLTREALAASTGTAAIILAVGVNLVVKAAIAAIVGGRQYGIGLGVPTVIAIVAGVASYALYWGLP